MSLRRRQRKQSFSTRPENFVLDPSHYFADSLVFAGLGQVSGWVGYLDSSSYANVGTYNGEAEDWIWNETLRRQVINLDGVNERVTVPHKSWLSLSGPYSICMWFESPALGNANIFLSKGTYNYLLYPQDRAGTRRFNFYGSHVGTDSDIYGDSVLGSNTLYHIAVTYDGNNGYKLFVDGSEETITGSTSTGPPATNTVDMLIGDHGGFGNFYNGIIGDVIIAQRQYSNNEIAVLADSDEFMLDGLIQPLRSRKTTFFLPGEPPIPTANPTPWHLFQSSM